MTYNSLFMHLSTDALKTGFLTHFHWLDLFLLYVDYFQGMYR